MYIEVLFAIEIFPERTISRLMFPVFRDVTLLKSTVEEKPLIKFSSLKVIKLKSFRFSS